MSKKTFQFKTPQKVLIESLIDLNRLHSPTASENYTRFTFFANNVCTFPAYLERMKESRGVAKLSYEDAMNLSLCLSTISNANTARNVLDGMKLYENF